MLALHVGDSGVVPEGLDEQVLVRVIGVAEPVEAEVALFGAGGVGEVGDDLAYSGSGRNRTLMRIMGPTLPVVARFRVCDFPGPLLRRLLSIMWFTGGTPAHSLSVTIGVRVERMIGTGWGGVGCGNLGSGTARGTR